MEWGKEPNKKHVTLWNMNGQCMKRQCAHFFSKQLHSAFTASLFPVPALVRKIPFLHLCEFCLPCLQPVAGKKVGMNAEMMKVIF